MPIAPRTPRLSWLLKRRPPLRSTARTSLTLPRRFNLRWTRSVFAPFCPQLHRGAKRGRKQILFFFDGEEERVGVGVAQKAAAPACPAVAAPRSVPASLNGPTAGARLALPPPRARPLRVAPVSVPAPLFVLAPGCSAGFALPLRRARPLAGAPGLFSVPAPPYLQPPGV